MNGQKFARSLALTDGLFSTGQAIAYFKVWLVPFTEGSNDFSTLLYHPGRGGGGGLVG